MTLPRATATLDRGRAGPGVRLLCIHGHFYQPPRENPWLGVVEPQPSARPYRDWNARVTAQSYAPASTARVLDERGCILRIVNLFEHLSFDAAPTLLAWLAKEAPAVHEAIVTADRSGRGALAHTYSHPIMPLSTPRDRRTQLRWGVKDFEHRFGRRPEGLWLPEMAVDRDTLAALAEAGVGFTILSPHQALRVRPLGAGEDAWQDVSGGRIDTGRLYRCVLAQGLAVDVAFRDAGLSQEIAFGDLLEDGAELARRLAEGLGEGPEPRLLTVAVDGETFGHHHRFGEMALAFALGALARHKHLSVGTIAAFRSVHPPADEVDIAAGTSWSCGHGVERWRGDCGCHVGGEAGWHQAWRRPLRLAIDWLRDNLDAVYAASLDALFADPWGARDRYIDCLLVPARREGFLRGEAGRAVGRRERVRALSALEMARHGLLMQTSCGWFFDELTGLEPLQVLAHAGRAIELAARLGKRLEEDFCALLGQAQSNLPGKGSGADIFLGLMRELRADLPRVAAQSVMIRHAANAGAATPADSASAGVPGYEVTVGAERRLAVPGGSLLFASVSVEERATGQRGAAVVASFHAPGGAVRCRVAQDLGAREMDRLAAGTLAGGHQGAEATLRGIPGREVGMGDLFVEGRLALLGVLGGEVEGSLRRAAREAVRAAAYLLEQWAALGVSPPPDLARAAAGVLGEELEAAIARVGRGAPIEEAEAVARRARRLGLALDKQGLRRQLARAIDCSVAAALGGQREAAARACALVDMAAKLGAGPDLWATQNRFYAEWEAARGKRPPWLRVLGERLGLAVDKS